MVWASLSGGHGGQRGSVWDRGAGRCEASCATGPIDGDKGTTRASEGKRTGPLGVNALPPAWLCPEPCSFCRVDGDKGTTRASEGKRTGPLGVNALPPAWLCPEPCSFCRGPTR
ncbi:hypothetical protein ISCGN_018628 [Ixodes scapularis]